MRLRSLLVLALAPVIADASSLTLAHNDKLDLDGKVQLLRGSISRGRHCKNMGSPVCKRNNVSVLERVRYDGKRERSLQFGDECATESEVICKSNGACGSHCVDSCPCDVDTSVGLNAYMQTMFEQLGPRCSGEDARVLMIGLGGGELTQYLLHHCPGMHVDAVELNGDVISLARAYFGLGESERKFKGRLTIEQADALTAVGERALAGEGYDAVLVDCFSGGGEVPESCRSRTFAEKVKAILNPAGVLLQNIWHYSKMRQQVSGEFAETKTIYRKVFDGALDDVPVPMPPKIRWVDILKATQKSEDLGETLERLNKE